MINLENISFIQKITPKKWTVIINCGDEILLPDGTVLESFDSGLFRDVEIIGDKILAFEIGNEFDVSDNLANFCRKNWTPVYEIFPFDIFKGQDFFRSSKVKIGDLEFNFWYCGENFLCGIHNEHNFFELHTQILGQGEMQKFHSNNENTIYYREKLTPGQTHQPFFKKDQKYPYHQYKSISKCIWLAIESDSIIPKNN